MRRSELRRKPSILAAICCLMVSLSTVQLFADDPAPTPEDLERLAAIEAFTVRQKAANYPEKFKKAAEEFGVPVEILMGISFAETRHEHLSWPEGETVSPENGMPRPYGIMSLWDNDIFGHTLLDAAKLIGQDPEVLKKDPYQNMRGGAALLKKHYDEHPKPEYAKEGSLESWKYAMVKYCGIFEPDLAHSHAWDVYDFLSQGYDQYGITLPEVPDLDLKSLYDETKRIREEQRKINEEKWRAEGRMDDAILEEIVGEDGMTYARVVDTNAPTAGVSAARSAGPKTGVEPAPVIAATPVSNQNGMLGLAAIALCAAALAFLIFRKKTTTTVKK